MAAIEREPDDLMLGSQKLRAALFFWKILRLIYWSDDHKSRPATVVLNRVIANVDRDNGDIAACERFEQIRFGEAARIPTEYVRERNAARSQVWRHVDSLVL